MQRNLLLVYLLIAVVYSTLVTSMTGQFIGPEWLSSVYDSLGSHLLTLRAEVDEDAIKWEGLSVNGRVYAYFGPFPAFLRIIVNGLFPEFRGQWSRVSCLIAGLLCVVSFGTMTSVVLGRNGVISERTRRLLVIFLVLGFAFGTPVTYLVSCARIYHEGILWGLCGAMWCACVVATIVAAPSRNNTTLFLFSCAVFVTLLSRITFGVSVVIAAPLVFLLVGSGDMADLRAWRGVLLRRLVSLAPLYAALAIGAWYNYARFGSPFKFFDYQHFYLKAQDIGGEFNVLRIYDALRSYMGLSLEHFMSGAPFVKMTTVSYARPELFVQGWTEETIPYSLASPWLVVLAGFGLGYIRRVERRGLFIGYAICLFIQALLILSFYFVTQRYSAELLPLLCFLCVPWLLYTRGSRWTVGVISVLVVFSSYVTVAATLDWNMVYNGDASLAYKRLLRSFFVSSPPLSNFDGRAVYLSDLRPISQTASFTPMRLDRTIDGAQFDVAGRVLPKGLGVHAHSRITYVVPTSAVRFSTILGPCSDEIKCARMSYRMRVLGDSEKVLYESETFYNRSLPVSLDLDVSGMPTLTLEVVPLTDGFDCDHANWIMAQFGLRSE